MIPGPVFPAASVALTKNVYVPGSSALSSCGDVQNCHEDPSSEQLKIEASLAENANRVREPLATEPSGPSVMVTTGATVSRAQLVRAGVGSAFRAGSTALTSNWCSPSGRTPYETGLVHGSKERSPSRHSNVAVGSSLENVNRAYGSFVRPWGPDVSIVSGGVTSGGGAGSNVQSSVIVPVLKSPVYVSLRLSAAMWYVVPSAVSNEILFEEYGPSSSTARSAPTASPVYAATFVPNTPLVDATPAPV